MDNITYEKMEKMYRDAASSSNKPDLSWTTIPNMRAIWGDEQVDAWIADGTIILEETNDTRRS